MGHLIGMETCKVSFNALKEAVSMAPDLDLPNLEKPFRLYVSERVATALGMLGQMVGPVLQPVAYLSKQLDEVAKGWPACLEAVAATTLMVKEALQETSNSQRNLEKEEWNWRNLPA